MENNKNCVQLMNSLSESLFYATDLQLFLDTHPDDRNALRMFREAVKRTKATAEIFEQRFYPLTAFAADDECDWEWLLGVWPSQKMV